MAEAASASALGRLRQSVNDDGYLVRMAPQIRADSTRKLLEMEGFSRCSVICEMPRKVVIEARL